MLLFSARQGESLRATQAAVGEPEQKEQSAIATDESLETPCKSAIIDPVSHLPPELATACFRFLGLRGRFAVSQVCRAWRRAALADCCLWNSLQTGAVKPRLRELLETLLARSGSVPFNFGWVTPDGIPDDVLDVLTCNMHRMGKLKSWGASPRLLQHAAPALRQLVLDDLEADLPADWTHSVPRLEVLELDDFSIPADFQPLPVLTSFRGCLAEGSSVPVLARVFPRLVALELEGVTQETLPVLGAPPPCRSVVLRPTWANTAIDYAPFQRACHGHRVARIALSSATSVGAAAEEFARATRGECTMFVRSDASLTLKSAADGIVRVVKGDLALPIVAELGGLVHLAHRLAELTLPFALLLGIAARQAPGLSFPSLRLLRLLPAPADVGRPPAGAAPLAMPRLAEVALELYLLDYARDESAYYRSYNALSRRHVEWLLADWPVQLRALVLLAHGLDTLTVVMSSREDAEHFAARQDLGALRALADTLTVTHRSAFHSQDADEYVEDYEDEDDLDEY